MLRLVRADEVWDEQKSRAYGVYGDVLSEMIAREKLPAGDRLPSERRLANDLGLRRGKVHEMFKGWENEGRIVIRPGAGCFLQGDGSRGGGVLDMLGSRMQVTDIFEVRPGLEVTSVIVAAIRATTDDVDQMGKLLEEMRVSSQESHSDGLDRFIQTDRAFYRAT